MSKPKHKTKPVESTEQPKVAFGLTLEELWQLFPIEIVEHDPSWKDWYLWQERALLELLGDAVAQIDHIGSTSVDGLEAKPIVDVLLQIAPDADTDELSTKLAAAGWLQMHEQHSPYWQLDLNIGYTPNGFADKVYHLHVRRREVQHITSETNEYKEPCKLHTPNSSVKADELHFRDYLRAHHETATKYATLKKRLAVQYKHDRDAYTEAKSEFIHAVTTKAKSE